MTIDELSKLCSLFGVSADALLYGEEICKPATVFARSFERLNERDQAEIMNLIQFKGDEYYESISIAVDVVQGYRKSSN